MYGRMYGNCSTAFNQEVRMGKVFSPKERNF